MNSRIVTVHMRAQAKQYFSGALFMLRMEVLTFESVDEILQCDHSNET